MILIRSRPKGLVLLAKTIGPAKTPEADSPLDRPTDNKLLPFADRG